MLDCICDASYLSRFNRITVEQFSIVCAYLGGHIFEKFCYYISMV